MEYVTAVKYLFSRSIHRCLGQVEVSPKGK